MKVMIAFDGEREREEFDAQVFGLLAVHETPYEKPKPAEDHAWTVTHIPTGGSIARLPTEEAAVAFAKLANRATIPDEPDPAKASAAFLGSWLPFREAAVLLAKGDGDDEARAKAIATIKAFVAAQKGKKA